MADLKLCPGCPWRKSNHGKRSKHGFYTRRNLRRLWGEIRGGGGLQTCHLTDPTHPDHVDSGTPVDATPHECAGSVALAVREIEKFERIMRDGGTFMDYVRSGYAGMTREGLLYFAMGRFVNAGIRRHLGAEGDPMDEAPTIPRSYIDDTELIARLDRP